MIYDRSEALRYLGTSEEDVKAAALVDLLYLKMRNVIQARSAARTFACRIDMAAGLVELSNGTVFHSKVLAEHLGSCSKLIVFAATLGVGVDNFLRRTAVESTAEAAAAQAVAAAVIETYCDCETERLVMSETGYFALPRFSPGYADWALEEQKLLMPLIACQRIGLTLTDGCMLAPVKSVTAVIGLSTEQQAVQCHKHKCAVCSHSGCAFRNETSTLKEDYKDEF